MSPRRFYLPPEQCQESTLFLAGREAHHAMHVIRVRKGDAVTVLDGAGQEIQCHVEGYDRDKVRLAVREKFFVPRPDWHVTLFQAVPKGKLMESIIQKATELGVFRIVPVLAERVVTQFGTRDSSRKRSKWQVVAMEAVKQCGSPWLPQVEAATPLGLLLERKEPFEMPLIASLQPGAQHPRAHFEAFENQHGGIPRSIAVWIGPEGDFSTTETAAIQATGALPITLGRLVLRTETAATYCLSVVNYELEWRKGGKVP